MYAAGMTLKEENYQNFKNAFENEVKNTIHPDLLIPEISVDLELDFSDIDEKFMRILKQFEPFGPENMTPVFMSKNVVDSGYAKTLGNDAEHLKVFVKQNNSANFNGIGFGLGKKINIVKNKQYFDVVYVVEENEWNGNVSLKLQLRDIRQKP
jgi:single-stranded-DNA-specific exonuclease